MPIEDKTTSKWLEPESEVPEATDQDKTVTAPATEVASIHGLSTNAMPPQGDCFMASMCCDYVATLANSEELTRST